MRDPLPLPKNELKAALVARRPGDHKGVFGHVLIAAGSRGMAGAAILAARAALRSGAGLVTLAVPKSLQKAAAGAVPEAMTLALAETASGAFAAAAGRQLIRAHKIKGYTVLAVGPGLSVNPATGRFVLEALRRLPLPAVVDADALNNLALEPGKKVAALMAARAHGCIFTPHPGEMARCLGLKRQRIVLNRRGAVESLAKRWRGTALLKGKGSLISNGRRTIVNTTGGPGLAKGGSGDVLTGLIAGLWAQMLASGRVKGDTAFLAAALGAYLHGLAGDLAQKKKTAWVMTAQDVIALLPAALRRL